ncbi:hypothetical protein MB27_17755 [Actinoplanes utahensis]|uniref:Uncharacterized protein n=2 Tax=Actinoplanes utahensis TaxID=1869 RepID=A0A0A6UJJ8_ACTUT|nr:hypothetical protein MB27_17755 [Actinoplanes utahensis]
MIAQCGVMVSTRSVSKSSSEIGGARFDELTMWPRSLPGAGIETSTRMGSDQMAAEALQEAETEVVIARTEDRARVSGSPTRRSMSALRPES